MKTMEERVKRYVEGFSIEELSGMIREIETRPKDKRHRDTRAVLTDLSDAKTILEHVVGDV